jgi:hypothetical protein
LAKQKSYARSASFTRVPYPPFAELKFSLREWNEASPSEIAPDEATGAIPQKSWMRVSKVRTEPNRETAAYDHSDDRPVRERLIHPAYVLEVPPNLARAIC